MANKSKVRYNYRPKYIHADLRNKYYCEWIRFLRASENWSKEQIEEYQLNEIKRIVRYAYENTNGYRRLYDDSGITPDSIKTVEDFRELPFVTKEMIRDNLEDFSVNTRGRKYVTTGGSTGIPFGFYLDRIAFAKELASKAYQYYRVGWREGDRQIVLRGLVIPSPNHIKYYSRFNELRFSSYHLTRECMEPYRQRAFEFQPNWIKCYPSSGYIFAKLLEEVGRPFPSVKGVLCASENLYDFQKELLSEVFKARVFSHYGHYEMAVLAGFCEYEDTYHVLPQYGHAELIDKDGDLVTKPGEIGEIVGTSFIMHATPFIRYRTGDIATLKGWYCASCGRPYQTWERIEGRLQEFIVTATSRYVSMTAINMHDDIFDHVTQFQFCQEEKGHVVFRFIRKDTCSEKIISNMQRRLLVKLGSDVELEMEPVEEIPLTPSGKHRLLIQKLKLEFGDE
jgi:phenylacetate-CoA ligase